ncbi:hypothetical protein HMPREF3201_00368 [Megasphaera sp. MJR8396C]|nr:hypothetical protein HMPREF3201_00368 [Megasphaera sp. MJR8396C]
MLFHKQHLLLNIVGKTTARSVKITYTNIINETADGGNDYDT